MSIRQLLYVPLQQSFYKHFILTTHFLALYPVTCRRLDWMFLLAHSGILYKSPFSFHFLFQQLYSEALNWLRTLGRHNENYQPLLNTEMVIWQDTWRCRKHSADLNCNKIYFKRQDSQLALIHRSWCLVMAGTEYTETLRVVSLPVTTSCLAVVMHTERDIKGENQDMLLLLEARVM